MTNPTEAERLKAEGNTLFVKKDFAGAYQKFTEALQHDDKNAILYCNRAACSLGLNRYLEAYTDAEKATELSSTYAKAWSRLAAASAGLGKPDDAISHWKRALAVLPVENLTPAEQKQKEHYTAELKTALARKAASERHQPVQVIVKDADSPWNRAVPIIQSLPTPGWNSSAWIIVSARQFWVYGCEAMNQLRLFPISTGTGCFGLKGGIEGFSNALLQDSRTFSIADKEFFDKYNRQMIFELTETRAWSNGSSRTVMQDAPKRLQEEGWDATRPALAITVRGWIMRAFMQSNLTPDVEAALDFYTSAIEVLSWGIDLWKDVPNSEKGSIFQPSFLRGVKCLRLDAMLQTQSFLDEISRGAQDLIDDIASAPMEPPTDTGLYGHYLSFARYPLAQAHSLMGFCRRKTAMKQSKDSAESLANLRAAAESYARAAEYIPVDDEKHVSYLHHSFDCLLDASSPAAELVAILDRIHEGIPIMRRIWQFSGDAPMRDAMLSNDMRMRTRLLACLQNGTLQADTVVNRDMLQ
ncbi:hypothetical protein ONZ51_g3369 [Trametes cubensis]|uniref:TPR-like protein n=1 Tax=Trametes cubensis TaxID=1111947 RepID=A0AAD7TYY4_9APHY|nr:hypothetical protein ONZ51_g3369 [Trametes cubensis]